MKTQIKFRYNKLLCHPILPSFSTMMSGENEQQEQPELPPLQEKPDVLGTSDEFRPGSELDEFETPDNQRRRKPAVQAS